MKLTIDKKTFELKFGFKCFMILGRKLGLNTFNEVVAKFANFTTTDDVSFDQLELIELLVISAIEANPKYLQNRNHVKDVSVIDYIMANPDVMAEIMQAFSDSFPKVDEQGKQQAVQKSRKARP